MQEWTLPGRKVLAGTCRRVGRALAHSATTADLQKCEQQNDRRDGKRLGPQVQLRFVGQSCFPKDLMISGCGGGAYELAIWAQNFHLEPTAPVVLLLSLLWQMFDP